VLRFCGHSTRLSCQRPLTRVQCQPTMVRISLVFGPEQRGSAFDPIYVLPRPAIPRSRRGRASQPRPATLGDA
jgi:hypothetical protein